MTISFSVLYAQAAIKSSKTVNIWIKVESKIKERISKEEKSSHYRDKYLVTTLSNLVITIDFINVRDKINKTLKTKEILKVIISII